MCDGATDLHGVVLAGDGAGPGVAAVLLARHLHVIVGAAVDQSEVSIQPTNHSSPAVGLQGEALEGELNLGAGSHGQVPLLVLY